MRYPLLLYRKHLTRKIRTKVHPGPGRRILHILTSENTDDVISLLFHSNLCKKSVCLIARYPVVYSPRAYEARVSRIVALVHKIRFCF